MSLAPGEGAETAEALNILLLLPPLSTQLQPFEDYGTFGGEAQVKLFCFKQPTLHVLLNYSGDWKDARVWAKAVSWVGCSSL